MINAMSRANRRGACYKNHHQWTFIPVFVLTWILGLDVRLDSGRKLINLKWN